VLLPDTFFSTRASFLIAPDGRVTWKRVEESPSHERSDRELLERLSAST
jgi:hypothetical protein